LIDGHETEICDPAYIDQISEEEFGLIKVFES